MPDPASEWISGNSWGAIVGLQAFQTLPQDITMRPNPWQKLYALELPLDYTNKTEFQKLWVIRALRPDRMVNPHTQFISSQIGEKYTEDVVFTMQRTFDESASQMALFRILSPWQRRGEEHRIS